MSNAPNRPDPGLRGHGRAPLSGPHAVSRLRVLIVEADPADAQALAAWVEHWGHEVAVADSPALALALAEARPPHVVLLGSELGSLALGLARQMYRLVLPHEVLLVAQTVPGDVGVYALRPVDLAADLAALAAQEALLGRREPAAGTADSNSI